MALMITTGGGLCLFAGMLLLGHVVGSYELDRVLASGDLIRGHDLYTPILILVALGVLTKTAPFPFTFCLPHALAPPPPGPDTHHPPPHGSGRSERVQGRKK